MAVPVMVYPPLLDTLRDGERVHQLMVDSKGDYAIFMLDSNGYVASWNTGAQQIKGYSREEIVGKHFSVFYSAEDRARKMPEQELAIAARDGRFEDEGTRVRKDGSEFWANVVISAVRDENDVLVGFVKVTRDLTEQRKAEERAVADAQALKAVAAELESFTYSVSHDLRAPIRQILGFSKILAEHLGKDIDPEVEHYLRRIDQASGHMSRLVDDLLQLAQLDKQEARPRLCSLDSVMRNVLTNIRAETRDRSIEWKVEPLPSMVCDPGLLHILFTNLLSNAVKYTRPRQNAVIEIGKTVKDRQVVIFVRDNGVGFDMKYANRLFGVFQRLHPTEEYEGAGIGLATVQRIIRKHKGTIWAESAPNAGTTFFFTIPAPAT